MLWPEFYDPSCIIKRIPGSFSRHGENEVEVDIIKADLSCYPEISDNVTGRVYPAHEVEPVIIHRLHSH